jgi:hypothetical protein
MLSQISRQILRTPLVSRLSVRQLSSSLTTISNLSSTSKLLLSVGGYMMASLAVAKTAEKKNLGYVFKQLGSW